MALALPIVSLLSSVPLGVDLAYLYSQSKTNANGSTPMAESGIRAELTRALTAEYTAFADADRAVITKALTEEMDTWKNQLPKAEAPPTPSLGSRALQATGALIAAPIALPVAGVAMAYTAAIDYMKKRSADAAERKAELEAAKKTQEGVDARHREARQKEDEARALNDTATLNAAITLRLRLKAEADKAEADRQSAARAAAEAAAATEAAAKEAGEQAATAAAEAATAEAAAAAAAAVSEAGLARIEAAADGAAAEAAERRNSDPAPSQSNVATPILGPAPAPPQAVDPQAIAFAERNAAAVESGGPSAFRQAYPDVAFPAPNESELLKEVAEDKSLAAQVPSQTSSEPTPDAKAQETCEPTVYLEKRKALIDALENRAKFKKIPKLWSRFVDTCLQGDSPPMPLSREWRAAGQDVDKQKAALVNLVATLKTMGVLDDTLEEKIVSNWTTEFGGRRPTSRKGRKGRQVRKARNSTFRRHRKH